MNPRLLSAAQKAKNAKERGLRKTRRQWCRRREALLTGLAVTVGDAAGMLDLLTPEEASVLLSGHLNGARPIAARISRLVRGCNVGEDVQHVDLQLPAVVRPRRVLKQDYRSQTYPWLVSSVRPSESNLSLVAALSIARGLAARGESPHGILDYVACASGLPWDTAAVILHRERLIPAPFSDIEIDGIRRARVFWDRYNSARATYGAKVRAGELSAIAGDWATVDDTQLQAVFPGIKVPRHLGREAYMVNRIGEGVDLCFGFHACPSRLPLFLHPF